MRMEFEDGVVKVFPTSMRDDKTLENEFQVRKPGDVITLVRVDLEPTPQNKNPFYLKSERVDVVALNRATALAKREEQESRVDEPEETAEEM